VSLTFSAADTHPTQTSMMLPGWDFFFQADPASPVEVYWNTRDWVISYYSSDYAGNTEACKQITIGVDLIPPVFRDTGVASGWHGAPVDVELIANDQNMPTGSGVASIQYREGGGEWTTVDASTATVTVPAQGNDGQHTYSYRANDVAGNVSSEHSFTVDIETVAPTTAVFGVPEGWSDLPVTVTLMATDAVSGVASIEYRLQGASAWTTYFAPFTVTAGGASMYEYRSTDLAGNVEATRTFTVRRTVTPVLTIARDKASIKLHGSVRISGSVTPPRPGETVKLLIQKKNAQGVWKNLRSTKLTLSSGGAYLLTYRPAARGSYRVQAGMAAATGYKAVTTGWKTFRVK
jgi:hypothetical protein